MPIRKHTWKKLSRTKKVFCKRFLNGNQVFDEEDKEMDEKLPTNFAVKTHYENIPVGELWLTKNVYFLLNY